MSNPVKAYLGSDPYIFISYAHRDKDRVLPFIAALQQYYNVWFDEGIHYGEEWEDEIIMHLKGCEIFVYMITPASLESSNCKDEIRTARDLNKKFINIMVDSETELTDVFKFRYGGYQMCLLYTFRSLNDAVDDLGRKSPWFEAVRRRDADETYQSAPLTQIETSSEPQAVTAGEKKNVSESPAQPEPPSGVTDEKSTDKIGVKSSDVWDERNVDDSDAYGPIDLPETYRREGNVIYFGEYPQTVKSDKVDITATTDSRGYYLGTDGAYYAKVVAAPFVADCRFGNGATVQSGKVYYFRVEPIRWRILDEGSRWKIFGKNSRTTLIICDSIIAAHRYAESTKVYAESEIRAWLNQEFWQVAFSTLQQRLIGATGVDNSARSANTNGNARQWNDGKNDFACKNTNDKIFLLSMQEVTTAYKENGFNTSYTAADRARVRGTTDFARASGAEMSTESTSYGNGWWWLRSPNHSSSFSMHNVTVSGSADETVGIYKLCGGVVPALRIKL